MIIPYYYQSFSLLNGQYNQPSLIEKNKTNPPLYYFEGRRLEKYRDLIANLSEVQRVKLEDKIGLIADHQVETAVEAILRGDLSAPVFKDNDFPLSALLALKEGLIDGLTFSTSQMFGNALNWAKPWTEFEIIPLFNGDAINDRAWRLIKETCKPFMVTQFSHEIHEIENEYGYEDERPLLNDDQLKTFFALAKELPAIDRQFLVFRETNPINLKETHQTTVSVMINTQAFNALSRISDSETGSPLRMVPSKGIIQALLIAKWGESAPTLISRFLISPSPALAEEIPVNERDFCLNFSHLPLVTKADLRDCDLSLNEVEYHDGYHGYIFGSIPAASRIKFYECAHIFKNWMEEEAHAKSKSRFAFECAFDSIVDMEHGIYTLYKKEEIVNLEEEIFWTSIVHSIIKSSSIYFYIHPKAHQLKAEKVKELFRSKVFKVFVNKIIDYADDYRRKGIKLDYLLSDEKNVIDSNKEKRKELELLSNQTKKILRKRFHQKSKDKLVRLSKNRKSYLLREGAKNKLKSRPRLPLSEVNSSNEQSHASNLPMCRSK